MKPEEAHYGKGLPNLTYEDIVGTDLFVDYTLWAPACLRLNRMVAPPTAKMQPDDETVGFLQQLWFRMDPELQKAFSIAYNDNRRAGDGGIQTRDLFAALLRVGSSQLKPFVNEIPEEALPAPRKVRWSTTPTSFQDVLGFHTALPLRSAD